MNNINQPEISIIVRTKNRSSLLKEALESILKVSIEELELKQEQQQLDKAALKSKTFCLEAVVVNDGGECVGELVHNLLKGKIAYKYINIQDGVGRSEAANRGVEESSGQWLCFLDDDDILVSDGLAHCFNLIKDKKASDADANAKIYHGKVKALRYKDLSDNSNAMTYTTKNESQLRDFHINRTAQSEEPFKIFAKPFNADAMLWENYIPINALIIPKNLFLQIGGFDSSLSCFEDWDLVLRLSDIAEFEFIPVFTAVYRIFDHSFIVGGGGEKWQEKGRLAIYRKHWHRYDPDTMVKMYNAVNKDMRGEFLPEMARLKEQMEQLRQERSAWTDMDKEREIYIRKIEDDAKTIEQNTREREKEWEIMDKEREIYIRKIENDIKTLEDNIRKERKQWEDMDTDRVGYVNDLLRHIKNLEASLRA
ncbi:MAG: glycosyltransferase family 2 protein [Desulfamplus sp.]